MAVEHQDNPKHYLLILAGAGFVLGATEIIANKIIKKPFLENFSIALIRAQTLATLVNLPFWWFAVNPIGEHAMNKYLSGHCAKDGLFGCCDYFGFCSEELQRAAWNAGTRAAATALKIENTAIIAITSICSGIYTLWDSRGEYSRPTNLRENTPLTSIDDPLYEYGIQNP